MKLLDFSILLFFAAWCVLLTAASIWMKRNVWFRCPRCRRWHSKMGVLNYGVLPSYYAQRDPEPKKCDVCK